MTSCKLQAPGFKLRVASSVLRVLKPKALSGGGGGGVSDLPAGGAGRVHRWPDVSPGTMYASYYSRLRILKSLL